MKPPIFLNNTCTGLQHAILQKKTNGDDHKPAFHQIPGGNRYYKEAVQVCQRLSRELNQREPASLISSHASLALYIFFLRYFNLWSLNQNYENLKRPTRRETAPYPQPHRSELEAAATFFKASKILQLTFVYFFTGSWIWEKGKVTFTGLEN